MDHSRRGTLLLCVVFCARGLWLGLSGSEPASMAELPSWRCAIAVEVEGRGVTCLEDDTASKLGLRPGDRLGPRSTGGGPGPEARPRMEPERLRAWAVPIDVNRASLEELASLEGVGPALARRIAAARPFAGVEDLLRVRGIGRRKLDAMRPRLCGDGALRAKVEEERGMVGGPRWTTSSSD